MHIQLGRNQLGVRIDLTEPRDVFLELLAWRRPAAADTSPW